MPDDLLDDELRALGRLLDVPPAPDPTRMAARVRQRLVTKRPAAAWRRLGYAAATAVVAFAVLMAGSPQVRAVVVEFFRFGGVVVERAGPTPTNLPGEVPATPVDGVAAAQARVPFPVRVPAELGPPDEVSVTDGRVVSFTYHAAGVRLDQFGGTLDPAFAKQLPSQAQVEWTQVDGATALWIRGPHELVYLDRDGQRRTESARLAANTLVWQHGEVTLRLEGASNVERAIAIAQSMR